MPLAFLHPILILLFFFLRLSLAALEDKLDVAEFINFASAWNNFDAFGMLDADLTCSPRGVQSARGVNRSWGTYARRWDHERTAS